MSDPSSGTKLPASLGWAWVLGSAALAWMSYGPLTPDQKLVPLFLLLLTPFLGGWFLKKEPHAVPEGLPEFSVPAWVWLLFFLFLLTTRFWRLTTDPFWPLMDEGRQGLVALELSHHWSWNVLWTEDQMEAGFLWLMALFFKAVPPSLFALRLLPALLSILTVAASYWAARKFFPQGFSFILSSLMAFSFWPFTFSRFSMRVDLLLFVECLALGALGLFKQGVASGKPWMPAVLLGIVTGFGFYTYTSWPVVALFLSIAAGYFCWKKSGFAWKAFGSSLLLVLLLAAPWFEARFLAHHTAYIQDLWGIGDLPGSLLRYLAVVFCDGFGSAPFGPDWGGFLNPVLGAGALLGLAVLVLQRNGRTLGWVFLAGILALLPGVLTSSVEPHRITQLLPLVIFLEGLGLVSLLGCFPLSRRWAVGALLFLASFLLDAYHFQGPYQDPVLVPASPHWRSVEMARAYSLMRQQASQQGPGILLDDLAVALPDENLKLADYAFDPMIQPQGDTASCRWIAMIVNSNEVPFLQKRFPGSSWTYLAPELPVTDGKLSLGLLPREAVPSEVLADWRGADAALQSVDSLLVRHFYGQDYRSIAQALEDFKPLFQNDPWLRSVYWEKKALLDSMDSRLLDVVEDLQQALKQGYPAAHLFDEEGPFLEWTGHPQEAKVYFGKALKCPLNHTQAARHLGLLVNPGSGMMGGF